MKMLAKRILSMALALCLGVTMLLAVIMQVEAATYNASAAVSYANAHWNDGVGLCAEFVSKCLAAGGVTIPNRASYYSSSTQSYNNNSGTLGVYTNPYTCSASLLLYLSKYYTVITNPASSQIDVGDVVFMYSGEWRDGHVGIIINKNNGIPTYAAHNRATNTGKFYSNYPCTYVVKMNGLISPVTHTKTSSYGTNFTAYPKAKITAENIFDAYHNQIDSTSWIGTSDKCTIQEVYTDGCCKVTYPLDAGGTKTVYSKISLFNTHTHSYTGSRYYESAHPHAITQRCVDYDTCGGWTYTGEYYEKNTCEQCWHADFDIGASSISVKVGESKTVSATVSGCLPDSAVLYRSFSPDNDVVEVTIKNQQATFTGLKAGTTSFSLTVYSDSSKSHVIETIIIPVTVTAQTCTSHSYSYKVTTNPSTTTTGTLTGICSKCSATTTVSLPKLNATNYTYKVTKTATCTATGIGRYSWKTTTYGSFYFDVSIGTIGHKYTSKVTVPTCTAQGYTSYTCSICENSYKDTYTNATGHSYNYKVTKAPTISASGTLTGTCAKCSGMTSVTLPKLNTTDYAYKVTKDPSYTATGTGKYTWKTTTYGTFYFDVTLDKLTATLTKIEVATKPTKTVYEIGESLDITGLTLKATYSDGSTKLITSGFTTNGFDSAVVGEKTVAITYGGKSASVMVTVKETEEIDPDAPKIVVESKTVSSGGTVTLEVEIANNPGFSYLKFAAVYDSAVFEFVGATNGTISNEDFEVSGKNVLWSTDADAESDGLLVTLTFKVKENAEEGAYAVGVRLIECFNGDEEEVPLAVTNGTVKITDIIYGDVNGDGKVDGRDMIRLKKYLANYDDETGISTVEIFDGADCNGDNKVNGRDLIRLKKYLANYDDETGSSTVVLGP